MERHLQKLLILLDGLVKEIMVTPRVNRNKADCLGISPLGTGKEIPEELKALGAYIYTPSVSGTLMSDTMPNKVLQTLYRPSWDLENAQVVRGVRDEYSHIVAQTCDCGGVYGISPLTKGQVAFKYESKIIDALVTQCLLCGEERSFLFDVTSCYGIALDTEYRQFRERVNSMSLTRLAHAFTRVVFGLPTHDKEHSRFYSVVREVLEKALDHQHDLLREPIDIQAIKSEVQTRLGLC